MKSHRARYGGRALVGSVLTAVLGALLLGGCEPEQEPFFDGVDYSGWRQTTNVTLNFPVPGHGDSIRVIYANDLAYEAQPDEEFAVTYPTGSMIVKEGYRPDADPTVDDPFQLYIMIKDPANERSRGGWVWFTRHPLNGTETVFDEEYCVTCHTNANESHPYGVGNDDERFRDYVFHAPAFEARGLPDE